MSEQPEVLYTAEASVTGGREGHARTSDGRLDVELDVPREMGGTGGPGTNPEQLFAAGYAACFQSALQRIATGRKLDVTGWRITARVGIGPWSVTVPCGVFRRKILPKRSWSVLATCDSSGLSSSSTLSSFVRPIACSCSASERDSHAAASCAHFCRSKTVPPAPGLPSG